MSVLGGEPPNWQANLLKHLLWQTQRKISKPTETHHTVLSLATETPLLEGVGPKHSWLTQRKISSPSETTSLFCFSLAPENHY